MSSVNKVTLIGRLGQDPEVKYTPNGMTVCNVSVATSESWTDKSGQKQERTEWHRVVAYGKVAEILSKYTQKGSQIYIEGRLSNRDWTDKEGVKRYTTEIILSQLVLLGGKGKGSSKNDENIPDNVSDESGGFTSDDIPF